MRMMLKIFWNRTEVLLVSCEAAFHVRLTRTFQLICAFCLCEVSIVTVALSSGVPRGGLGGSNPPEIPKFGQSTKN
jgi:hypothetical protein